VQPSLELKGPNSQAAHGRGDLLSIGEVLHAVAPYYASLPCTLCEDVLRASRHAGPRRTNS